MIVLLVAVLFPAFAAWPVPAAAAPPATPGLVVRSESLILTDVTPQMGAMFMNVVEIANEGKQDQTEVVLPVMPGYHQMRVMGPAQEGVTELGDRVVIRTTIPAGGSRQFQLTYGVITRLPRTFHRARLYRTERMTVAMNDLEFTGEIPELQDAGTEDMGNSIVRVYRNRAPLDPAPDMQITIRANVANMRPYLYRMAGLFAIPVLGLLAIWVRSSAMKRRRAHGAAAPAAPPGAGKPRPASGKKKQL